MLQQAANRRSSKHGRQHFSLPINRAILSTVLAICLLAGGIPVAFADTQMPEVSVEQDSAGEIVQDKSIPSESGEVCLQETSPQDEEVKTEMSAGDIATFGIEQNTEVSKNISADITVAEEENSPQEDAGAGIELLSIDKNLTFSDYEEGISASSANIGATVLPEGTYLIRSVLANTQVLDITNGSVDQKTYVQLYASNMTDAQKFYLSYDNEGYATFTNVGSGLVLDVCNAATADCTRIWQYPSNGTAAQKWVVEQNEDGSFTFVSAINNASVLDVCAANTSNTTPIQLYSPNGTDAQKFELLSTDTYLSSSSASIEDGTYLLTSAIDSSYSLSVPSASQDDGIRMQLYEAIGDLAQTFRIEQQSDGTYTIRNLASSKALDVKSGNLVATTAVQQWEYGSSNKNQRWSIQDNGDGTVSILAATSGLALDVTAADASNGTQIQLFHQNGTDAQKWVLSECDGMRTGIQTISAACTSRVLDVKYGSFEENAEVWIYSPNETFAQKFNVERVEGTKHTYTVESILSGYYLADMDGSIRVVADGTQQKCHWIAEAVYGGILLVNEETGALLDICGAGDFDTCVVQTYGRNESCAQILVFTAADALASEGTYTITAKDTDRAIDVNGCSYDVDANIQVWSANETGAQRFNYFATSDGYGTFRNIESWYYLDVENGSTKNGTNVRQWYYNGSDAQQFSAIYADNGWFYLRCRNGCYLTIEDDGTYDGANVVISEFTGNDSQKFKLTTTSSYSLSSPLGAVTGGLSIPLYLQTDSRWADVSYGRGTISSSACGPTAFAMVATYLKDTAIVPPDVVSWCGNTYYVSGAGTAWTFFAGAARYYETGSVQQTSSNAIAKAAIAAGKPVVCSQGPGLFTLAGHFIVIRGVTEDSAYLVNDPNDSVKKQYLNREFSWSEITQSAAQWWIFS